MPLTRRQDQPRIDQRGNNWELVFQRFDGTTDEPFDILNVPASMVFSNRYIDAHLSGSEPRMIEAIDQEDYWTRMFLNVDCLIEEAFDELNIFLTSIPREEEWYQELRDTIWSSPNANRPEDEISANTPEKLMRMQVLEMARLTTPVHQSDVACKQREQLFHAALSDLGIDVAASRHAVNDLLTYGPTEWHEEVFLDVVWRGKFEEAVPSDEERTLTIENPTLSLIDTSNGFHWDAKVNGSVQLTISAVSDDELPRSKRAYLDPRHHQID